MVSELNQTPKALRLHIGVFGDTNAGKSTFINAVTGQEIALTSPVAGTTTDPVFKPMELLPLGPVVFIDTAGLDDKSELSELRVQKSVQQLEVCNGAVIVVNADSYDEKKTDEYIKLIQSKKIPFMIVVNEKNGKKADIKHENIPVVCADLHNKSDIDKIKQALINLLNKHDENPPFTSDLVKDGDTVLLVMPQDIQAPKGRLIMPQVQTIRDLLDNKCVVISVTPDNLEITLDNLKNPPSLVITDSQIFGLVNKIIPKDMRLTSFSMLMAKIKGDINAFIEGAKTLESLKDGDKVLILESCAHHAMDDDIARVKIPNLIRKYTGKDLVVENVSGQNATLDLSEYKLAVHCGGCMLNRKAMINKQRDFEKAGVPMTNFGVCIAYINGILNRVIY